LAGSRKSRAGLVGNGARNGRPGDGEAAARASGCSRRVQSRGAPPLAFSFSLSLSLLRSLSSLSARLHEKLEKEKRRKNKTVGGE
jgi:hypothetical protein